MSKLTYSAFVKALREKKLPVNVRLFYFYGADTVSVEKAAKAAHKLFSPDISDEFNTTRFTSDDLNIDELSEVIFRLPFFAEYNCVILSDFNADSLGAGVFPKLFKQLEAIPETTVIIMKNLSFDVCGGKKAPVKNNKKLIEYIEKKGIVCECPQKTPSMLADDIIAFAKKNECAIAKQDAVYFAERCMCDSQLLKSELVKVCSYASGGTITRETIDSLVVRQFESDVFAISASIVSNDGQRAFRLLDEVFAQRGDEIAVIAALSNSFIELYRAKLAVTAGISAEQTAADFAMANRAFVVRNQFRSCRGIPLERLRSCVDILLKTDLKLKSTGLNKRVLVEKAVTEMLMCK